MHASREEADTTAMTVGRIFDIAAERLRTACPEWIHTTSYTSLFQGPACARPSGRVLPPPDIARSAEKAHRGGCAGHAVHLEAHHLRPARREGAPAHLPQGGAEHGPRDLRRRGHAAAAVQPVRRHGEHRVAHGLHLRAQRFRLAFRGLRVQEIDAFTVPQPPMGMHCSAVSMGTEKAKRKAGHRHDRAFALLSATSAGPSSTCGPR